MLKIKFLKLNKVIFLAFATFLISASSVSASNLLLTPEGGSYNVGDAIVVKLLVVSPNESINAVSSRLRFTQDNLSLVSISKAGSIISLWAQEPTFSNTAGTASFEGVTLGGYTGSGATVVNLTFRAKSTGIGIVNFISGSVLANDGAGTNTLKSMNEASFNIAPAAEVTTPTKPEPKEIKDIIKEAVTPKTDISENPATQTVFYSYIHKFDTGSILLLFIWVFLIFSLLYIYLRYRYKVDQKLEETKRIARKSFAILKEDIKEKHGSAIESDIYDAEKVIMDKIDDIEKM